jgi:glycosyltransferase involved in cell wall biosynthesis
MAERHPGSQAEAMPAPQLVRRVSVIVPARDEERSITRTVSAVLAQGQPGLEIEVLVVDDGSRDRTAVAARAAGARVLCLPRSAAGGNSAAARNHGARAASGDPVVFLDADCEPGPAWLQTLLAVHDRGSVAVGGSLELPPGLPVTARCDYYCGWYHVHSRRPAGEVPNHPPGNLSVRRAVFASTGGFTEQHPVAYAHEELAWQAEVRQAGGRIFFEPRAVAFHYNRPGFGNLLRRNYRWGYSAIESKASTGAARFARVYRYPALLVAASLPLALGSTVYILHSWLKAGSLEPLLMTPAVLAARLAYSAGVVAGGLRWMRFGPAVADTRPRWE